MKRFSTKILILLLVAGLYTNITFAVSSAETQISASKTSGIKKNDEINITISIRSLEDVGDGINAYVGTLSFDTTNFEFVKIVGKNNWNTPIYNANISNGSSKITATRGDFTTNKDAVLEITLKAERDVAGSTVVSLKDIIFAAKINGNTISVKSDDASISLVGNSSISQTPDETNNKELPKTGIINSPFFISIIAISFISVVMHIKYKSISKYIK